MAATQQSTLNLSLLAILSDIGNLANPSAPLNYTYSMPLDAGTLANQGNQVWSDRRTLASNTPETLDINGSLTNLLGQAVNFTKVKLLMIVNRAGNTTDLTIGNAAANGFVSPFGGGATNVVTVKPGGIFLITAPDVNGLAATAATADQLKVSNAAGAAATYDIVIIGC